MSIGAQAMPRLMERYMRSSMFMQQHSARDTAEQRSDALHAADPAQELQQRGPAEPGGARHTVERSPYTTLSMKSGVALPALVSAGVLFAGWRFAAAILARRTARKESGVVLGEGRVRD